MSEEDTSGPPPKLRELLEEIRSLEDPTMRSELLIEYGERFHEVPEHIAKRPFPEAALVPACESEAYVFPEVLADETLKFYFAVENPQGISAMALATILDDCLSGEPLEQVVQVSDDLVYDLFGRNISMGKGIGLRSMVQMTRALAEYQLKG